MESFLANSRWKDELRWAAWSPAEDIVAFTHGGPNFEDTSIYKFDVRSRDVTPLVEGAGGVLLWSSDGKQIAFRAETGLHVMNADGTGEHAITDKLEIRSWLAHYLSGTSGHGAANPQIDAGQSKADSSVWLNHSKLLFLRCGMREQH